MDGYRRQIHHGEYPLAIIAIDIASHLVDVNVHPRKTQVKFVDPGVVFSTLLTTIQETLGGNKIFQGTHTPSPTIERNETIHNNAISL
jgi:DNA mismatch repair ATPase MutL